MCLSFLEINNATNGIDDATYGGKWLTDLSLAYDFSPKLRLTLGINNLFDVYPDKHEHFANTNNGVLQYSRRVQQFGVAGRSWLVKALYGF